jgi:hypothetical protein
MHREGSSPSFHWPQMDDICWVEIKSILKVRQAPATGQDISTSFMNNTEQHNQILPGKMYKWMVIG